MVRRSNFGFGAYFAAEGLVSPPGLGSHDGLQYHHLGRTVCHGGSCHLGTKVKWRKCSYIL